MAEARTARTAAVGSHAANVAEAPKAAALLAHPVPVALIAAFVAVLAVVSAPSAAHAFLGALLAPVLVVLAATDLERRIIPNRIVLPATAAALVANIAFFPDRAPEFMLATVAVGVVFLLPTLVSRSLMGMGDVKLMMLLGAGLGWGAVNAIMIGFLALFPFALVALIRGGTAARKATLPFGPFLALGGLIVLIVPHLTGAG